MPEPREIRGLRYGPRVIGKARIRLRERHVADHLAPLMARNSLGAAKLDIALRGVALLPAHAGKRQPGVVLPQYSYEQLYDLVQLGPRYPSGQPGGDPSPPEVVRMKRKWVGVQLAKLEQLGLVERHPKSRPGRRPEIVVLRDDGSRQPFDDPDGRSPGNSYVTVSGFVISSGRLAEWSTSEISFYIASMVAERYENSRRQSPSPLGTGTWFQPLGWFADHEGYRPADHVRIPFSAPTLERGLRKLREKDLVTRVRTTTNPRTRQRLKQRRNLYTNHFDRLEAPNVILDESAFEQELAILEGAGTTE